MRVREGGSGEAEEHIQGGARVRREAGGHQAAKKYSVARLSPQGSHTWTTLMRTHPMARAIVVRWDEVVGWASETFGLYAEGRLVGGAVLSVQRIPYLPFSLSRINCLMPDLENPAQSTRVLLKAIARYSRRSLIVETELRLRIPEGLESTAVPSLPSYGAVFRELGFHDLSKVDSTYFVRIDRSDEALLKSFKPEYRNRIRKAKKNGVEIITTKEEHFLRAFYQAYVEMGARKKAPVPAEVMIGRALRPLIARGEVEIFVERYQEKVANMLIVDTLGIPCYVLGTRSEAHVQGQVPGAAQVLHYEIMRSLRDRGHRYYDLGGCEGPVPAKDHPNYGVWRFKHGFRGEYVRFVPFMRKIQRPLGRILTRVHVLRGDYV